jgi:hypothetical protein
MKAGPSDAAVVAIRPARPLAEGPAEGSIGFGRAAEPEPRLGEGSNNPKDNVPAPPREIATIVTATRTSSAVTAIGARA